MITEVPSSQASPSVNKPLSLTLDHAVAPQPWLAYWDSIGELAVRGGPTKCSVCGTGQMEGIQKSRPHTH